MAMKNGGESSIYSSNKILLWAGSRKGKTKEEEEKENESKN